MPKLVTVLDDFTLADTGLYAVYPYSKLVSTKLRVFVDFLVEVWSR